MSSWCRPRATAAAINKRLAKKGVLGGLPLRQYYPELGNAALWCCTERNTKAQIDAAAQEVK